MAPFRVMQSRSWPYAIKVMNDLTLWLSVKRLEIQWEFIQREANAAHLCAKQASVHMRRCLWINYNPNFLNNTLLSYCNPIK
jgi:hypothetical protein